MTYGYVSGLNAVSCKNVFLFRRSLVCYVDIETLRQKDRHTFITNKPDFTGKVKKKKWKYNERKPKQKNELIIIFF